MANSLQRDIEKGEVVVLKKKIFKPEYQDLKHRLFRCLGGFGLSAHTIGTALYGQYLDEDEDEDAGYREHSMDIDQDETARYQASMR